MSRFWEQRWYEGRAGPLSIPLRLAAAGFGVAVALKSRWTSSTTVAGIRVVSVGNLTVGGSGKTPVVMCLAMAAAKAGHRVAILSRGYGRLERGEVRFDASNLLPWQAVGDEPRLLAQRCPSATLWVGRDRLRLAQQARDDGATLALLDDGLQHRRLARDFDVVVVDSAVGFGNRRLLPAGPLREPLAGLTRASCVWVRETGPMAPGLEELLANLPRVVSRPRIEALGTSLHGKPVVALSGVARPGAFSRTLKALGASVCAERAFPDHHPFTARELEETREVAQGHGALIATTEKDAQRLPPSFEAVVVRQTEDVHLGADLLMAALAKGAS